MRITVFLGNLSLRKSLHDLASFSFCDTVFRLHVIYAHVNWFCILVPPMRLPPGMATSRPTVSSTTIATFDSFHCRSEKFPLQAKILFRKRSELKEGHRVAQVSRHLGCHQERKEQKAKRSAGCFEVARLLTRRMPFVKVNLKK